MRIFHLLGSVALVAGCATVGCAASPQESDGSSAAAQTTAQEESVAYGPCAASRATILASVSAGRSAAIARGFTWLDADVPFSETATHNKYRTDCSGFVSMCWDTGAPGANTRTLGTSGSGSYKLGSYDDLVPADALVDVGHHSVVFLGWNDTAHKGACVLEQSSTKNDMQFRVRMKSQLQGDGFIPVRSDDFKNDTQVYAPSTTTTPTPSTPDSTDTGTDAGTYDAGTDTDTNTDTDTGTDTGTSSSSSSGSSGTNETYTPPPPPPSTYEVPVCKSTSVVLVCAAAYAKGIECGRVIDNCGRAVDCTGMPGFGCGTGEACNANKCTSTCIPENKTDLCYSAQLKSGIECGTIPDGCGGTVDCGDLSYFRCAEGDTCGSDNKCPATSKNTGGTNGTPTTEKCEGPQDNPEVCRASAQPPPVKGDSGDDEGDAHTSSTRTASNDKASDEPAADGPSVASSGCSSAPGGSSSGLGGVAVAFFLVLGARRRRAASR